MAKELRLVIDVALCLRAWKKVARRQRQKREKAALSAPPPPLAEPQSPPPPVEPPPPTPPAATPAAPDAPQEVPVTDATTKPRPAPKPLRDKSSQLPECRRSRAASSRTQDGQEYVTQEISHNASPEPELGALDHNSLGRSFTSVHPGRLLM